MRPRIKLHRSGGTFTCPQCTRTNRHPTSYVEYRIEGHAYCIFCHVWLLIEGSTQDIARRKRLDEQVKGIVIACCHDRSCAASRQWQKEHGEMQAQGREQAKQAIK